MADIAAGPGLVEQIRLVAWLRWRILRNSLRKKSRRLDLLGLVISGLVSAIFVAGVTVAFFVGTQSLLTNHHEQFLGLLFLALFIWWQLFPILFAGFTAQFAFRSLLRFPLKLSAFYFIGMAYGLADSAALAALVWMIAMVAAAAIALPAIAPVMLLACVMFAILNVTIERLLGAWVEKLLAKRRSREVFFSLFLLAMVGLQFLSPIIQKYGRGILTVVRAWLPYLWLLPSSFAGDAIARSAQHQWTAAALKLGGLCVYVGLFTVLLWMRYAQLYSGEELSETVAPARKEKRATIVASTDENEIRGFLDPQILAILRKEIRYFKRNTFLFFGLVFPPMLVLFFSMQFGGAHPTAFKNSVSPDLFFPGMMAYLVLMLIAPAYNNFAYEGKGIQTYFTSPVRFREILLAKNLVTVLLLFCEITFCMALVGWRAGLPSVPVLFATLAGAVFSVAGQLTIANWSSLNFPRRMEFGKMQGQRQSGMSVLIIFGVQILFGGVSALVLFSGRWTGSLWLPAQLFTALAVAALAGYFSSLDAFTELAEKKKEVLIDTLCR
jgi:ABC-2 type transport system permease protein